MAANGKPDLAMPHLQRALALCRERRDPAGEAYSVLCLGEAAIRSGDLKDGISLLEQSLTINRECADSHGEVEALISLGEAQLGGGHPGDARRSFLTALTKAAELGARTEQARAHHGLARVLESAGDLAMAQSHRKQAARISTSFGA